MKLGAVDAKRRRSPIFVEMLFLLRFGQKGPQIRVSCFFMKMCHLIFLKTMYGKSYILDFLTQTPMSGKILVLEFSTKMFLTNTIAGFFKV